MIFYYGEYFSIAGDNLIIDEKNQNQISFDNDDINHQGSTAYGNINIIDELQRKYVWNFKCSKIESLIGQVMIGIDSSATLCFDQ